MKEQYTVSLGSIRRGDVSPHDNNDLEKHRLVGGQRQDSGVYLYTEFKDIVEAFSSHIKPIPVVTSGYTLYIGFPEEGLAQRVLKAFLHAADLCRTKEPF
jgi:hypothetical protein